MPSAEVAATLVKKNSDSPEGEEREGQVVLFRNSTRNTYIELYLDDSGAGESSWYSVVGLRGRHFSRSELW
jgi:hypothetical protein